MTAKRRKTPIDVQRLVLHESGYRCANPICRTIVTLDMHHLDNVSKGGLSSAENLLALCPNCHRLHHQGHIPTESLRTWKMVLLSLNEGFDRKSIDILLLLHKIGELLLSGEGVLDSAAVISSGLVNIIPIHKVIDGYPDVIYKVELTEKGHQMVEAWQRGDQKGVVNNIGIRH